jgi:hypothetical protein
MTVLQRYLKHSRFSKRAPYVRLNKFRCTDILDLTARVCLGGLVIVNLLVYYLLATSVCSLSTDKLTLNSFTQLLLQQNAHFYY